MPSKIIRLELLKQKLARIPEAIKKRAQADMMAAGRETNMLQRALAPSDDGTLRASIRTEALDDGTVGIAIAAGGPTTTKPVRKSEKGNAPVYDYALAQEYGTSDMPPNPFFWPGIKARRQANKRKIRAGVKRAIKLAIKK